MTGTTNAQKRSQAGDLHEFGDKKSQDWLFRAPKSTPARVAAIVGNMVSVAVNMMTKPFTVPAITMPKAESPYFRSPTQSGDQGMIISCDYYLGGVSGLGGGTATLTPEANLSTGVFLPISRTSLPPMVDPNAAQCSGPNGVVLTDTAGDASLKISPGGGCVIIIPSGQTVVIRKLPLSPPSTPGALWNSGNFVAVVPG